jgi:hypothetical protein
MMDKETEHLMLGEQYVKGYSKAEALLESTEFKTLLGKYLSELKNQYEVQGFVEGVCDTIELSINDVERSIK